jgi:hypothetical protein
MTAVLDYDPTMFETLPSFEEAQHNLAQIEAKLPAIAQEISQYDSDGRIGLALLHRHFTIARNEILVERVIPEERVTQGTPQLAGEVEVVPHLFRATCSGRGFDWHPVEFVELAEASSDASATWAWFRANGDMLNAVAAALEEEGALDAIGLSLSHGREEIACEADEVMVEETDEATRTLTMRPRRLDDICGISTPTNWGVVDGGVRMRCTCILDSDRRHGHFETN